MTTKKAKKQDRTMVCGKCGVTLTRRERDAGGAILTEGGGVKGTPYGNLCYLCMSSWQFKIGVRYE